MFLLYLLPLAFYCVKCINVELTGDVAFELKISDLDNSSSNEYQNRARGNENKPEDELSLKLKKTWPKRDKMTAAPLVECLYQYPKKKQVNAMLSNMMNELTKVFVRAQEFIGSDPLSRRKHETRFTVVNTTNTEFFESIYNNMTNEFRQFYNDTALRVDRSGLDPCQHQEEIKQMWNDLLKKSLAGLRRASEKCVEEFVKVQNSDTRTMNKLTQFLTRELGKIKSNQLDVLCDNFQLCYNDLL
ncbi:hypothetical protein K1T71_005854 [Dendrolimus kikuchii]|uniref:Uncharacterized protein n=1 Tax=Dendrolimus kikuchii TaxID=765133 RepID=A0ACC1D2G1_9NEOP|nr:hypothetical protein K1T71_005854 [Dendrolimus kikuchii]